MDNISYTEYIAEHLNKTISYAEYICDLEHSNTFQNYSEYVSENLSNISFSEYIAEAMDTEWKNRKRDRIIDEILNYEGQNTEMD